MRSLIQYAKTAAHLREKLEVPGMARAIHSEMPPVECKRRPVRQTQPRSRITKCLHDARQGVSLLTSGSRYERGHALDPAALAQACGRAVSIPPTRLVGLHRHRSSTRHASLPIPPCAWRVTSTPILSSGSTCKTSSTWKSREALGRKLQLRAKSIPSTSRAPDSLLKDVSSVPT